MKHGTKHSVGHINALLAEADEQGKYLYIHREGKSWRVVRVGSTNHGASDRGVHVETIVARVEVNPLTDTFDIR